MLSLAPVDTPTPSICGPWFNVTQSEIDILFRPEPTPGAFNNALLGFIRANNRFTRCLSIPPSFANLTPITRFAMVMDSVLIWFAVFVLFSAVIQFAQFFGMTGGFLLGFFGFNIFFSLVVFTIYRRWRIGINNMLTEGNKFGSARWAQPEELNAYQGGQGLYVGGGYVFKDKGHVLTVAGTRGGKGTNLIIPNLLGLGGYQGAWVVIDPKGENAAITARYQCERGQNVVILNAWGLLEDHVGETQSYNPLDILANTNSIHLGDGAQMIAEMLVPVERSDKNKFFTDTARLIVTGLIMQIVTTQEPEDWTLMTLWRWARLASDNWDELIARMRLNNDPVNGEIVRNAGNEIVKLMEAGEETFVSILSSTLQATDFLESRALQQSLWLQSNQAIRW